VDVLGVPVLVLNRSFQPVRVTTARRAFVMLYAGSARALDAGYEPHDWQSWTRRDPPEGAEFVTTPRGAVAVPRLLWLVSYNRVPRSPVRLSRRNVFLRDDYVCQYCGVRKPPKELNLDHVVPRARGGKSTWDNLVTSCRPCNVRKGDALPHECGMVPSRPPVRPGWSTMAQLAGASRRFPEWEPFLGTARERWADADWADDEETEKRSGFAGSGFVASHRRSRYTSAP
jgi:5-methylcytosine-specific restriction endonuclease McrA